MSVTNATASGKDLVLTGGDDGIARVWDPIALAEDGVKDAVAELDDGLGGCVTAVEWGKDGNICFVGGVDNEIKVGLSYSSMALDPLLWHYTDLDSSISR
jgi:Prp8 binding protein